MLAVIGTEARYRASNPWVRMFRQAIATSWARLLRQSACTLLALLCWRELALAQAQINADGDQQLLVLINQERAKAGVPPLALNEALTRAAIKHAVLMAREDSVVHQLPDEEPLALRVSDENLRCDHEAENIAMAGNLAETHSLLMQSPPHRANILNPQFNSVGLAIVQSGPLTYVTEDFAHVLPNYSEMEADAAAQETIVEFIRAERFPVPPRRQRPELTRIACDMAKEDKLDGTKAQSVAGGKSAVAWTSADLTQLPTGLKKMLSQPLISGYSLGVCFAPSAQYPSGVYWLVMVFY
jgi:uncharacterized protein YkwD